MVKAAPNHRQVATTSQHNISLCQGTNNVPLPREPIVWDEKVLKDLDRREIEEAQSKWAFHALSLIARGG